VDWNSTEEGAEFWLDVYEKLKSLSVALQDQLTSPGAALQALENCDYGKAKEILRSMVNK
jgi:hypothetical protein